MVLDNIRFAGMTKEEKKDYSVIAVCSSGLKAVSELTLFQAITLRDSFPTHNAIVVRTLEILGKCYS